MYKTSSLERHYKEKLITAEQAAAQYYTIRQGDNLGKIAGKYHTTVSRLCKLNNITPKPILRVGRRIRVR